MARKLNHAGQYIHCFYPCQTYFTAFVSLKNKYFQIVG
jgi:hypothetical protein